MYIGNKQRTDMPLAPNPSVSRMIGTCHWIHGISLFDGAKPITVGKHYAPDGKWKFTVELRNNEAFCVTRFNSIIYDIIPVKRFTTATAAVTASD